MATYDVEFTYMLPVLENGSMEVSVDDDLTPEELEAAVYLDVKSFVDQEGGHDIEIVSRKEIEA